MNLIGSGPDLTNFITMECLKSIRIKSLARYCCSNVDIAAINVDC